MKAARLMTKMKNRPLPRPVSGAALFGSDVIRRSEEAGDAFWTTRRPDSMPLLGLNLFRPE